MGQEVTFWFQYWKDSVFLFDQTNSCCYLTLFVCLFFDFLCFFCLTELTAVAVFFHNSFSGNETIWLFFLEASFFFEIVAFEMGERSIVVNICYITIVKIVFWSWHWWCRGNLFLVWFLLCIYLLYICW